MDNQPQPLPSQFFTAEAQYLLDASAVTEAKYVELARERAQQQTEAEAGANQAAAAIDAERRAAESLTDAELRDALQQAIGSYDYALNQVGIAEANVDRAKQRMDAADAELADYADLDDQITAHHVVQIKQGTDHPLPAALHAAEQQRGQLVDRIAANHRVHATLANELQEAQRHLAAAEAARSRAASYVIAKFYDAVATDLSCAIDQVVVLRRKLVSAAAVWIASPGGAAPLGLSSKAKSAVHRQINDVQPETIQIDAVRDWHTRLLNSADANATWSVLLLA